MPLRFTRGVVESTFFRRLSSSAVVEHVVLTIDAEFRPVHSSVLII